MAWILVRVDIAGRPGAVWLGVPYLAVPWYGATVYVALEGSLTLSLVGLGVFVALTVVWGALVDRAWQGRPVAVQVLALVAMVAAGGQLLFFAVIPAVVAIAFGAGAVASGQPSPVSAGDLAEPAFIAMAMVNVLALVTGLALRRARVGAWSEARHPLRSE